MSEERVQLDVLPEENGMRLDRFLASRHPERSRSGLARLIKEGRVLVDGSTSRPSEPVVSGSRIDLTLPERVETRVSAEDIPIHVVHEDEDLLVIEKAAGMVVHPGAGVTHGTLVSALLHHDPQLAGVGGQARAGLVHRLDRGTSGLMVIARNEVAHRKLSTQFREREIEKVYDAIVWGRPQEAEGEIELPIARDPRHRVKMTTRAPRGRKALSRYRVVEEVPGFASVAIRILTGRTHQVRVHLLAIGHPLVGDLTYGGDRSRSIVDPRIRKLVRHFERPALHARRLAFTHPQSGKRLSFVSYWPEDLRTLWEGLGGHVR